MRELLERYLKQLMKHMGHIQNKIISVTSKLLFDVLCILAFWGSRRWTPHGGGIKWAKYSYHIFLIVYMVSRIIEMRIGWNCVWHIMFTLFCFWAPAIDKQYFYVLVWSEWAMRREYRRPLFSCLCALLRLVALWEVQILGSGCSTSASFLSNRASVIQYFPLYYPSNFVNVKF